MDRRKQMILGGSALVVVFAAALGLGFTQRDEEPAKQQVELAATVDKAGQQACASTAAYDQLKGTLFADALKVRSSDPENLNTLASHSVVRMEDPVMKQRDSSSGAIACSGTFILELPPGAETAFGGQRRLTADIDYTARPAADGSGFVYQINGAERIMAQLADFNLQGRTFVPPLEETEFAEAQPGWLPMGMGGPEEPVPEEQADRAADIDRAEAAAERAARRDRVMRAAQEASEARRREQAEARAERRREQRRAESRPRGDARPSFNCRYARTRSERMVCEDRGLAARDREMAAMFYGAMDDADRRTRRELNRTRDRFLAYRDRCRSEECVAQAYEGRMREISDIMAASE